MKIKVEISEGVRVLLVITGVFVIIFFTFFALGWALIGFREGVVAGSVVTLFYLFRLLIGLEE